MFGRIKENRRIASRDHKLDSDLIRVCPVGTKCVALPERGPLPPLDRTDRLLTKETIGE